MFILMAITSILITLGFLVAIGFLIVLIVGASSGKKKTKKTGIIGLSISGGILILSLMGFTYSAISMANDSDTMDSLKSFSQYDDDTSSDDESDSSDDSNSDDDYDYNDVGDTVDFDSGERIKVQSIKDTSEKLPGQKGDEYGIVSVIEFTNTTKKPIELDLSEFDIFDDNDDEGEISSRTYDADIYKKTKVEPGVTLGFRIYFTVKNSGSYSITYGDVSWDQ